MPPSVRCAPAFGSSWGAAFGAHFSVPIGERSLCRKRHVKLPSPKIDDVFLLFYELPFDFTRQLPLALGPGVCLDETPWGLLDTVPPALADSILPGYHLRPRLRRNHCCLRSYDASIP